MAMYHYRLNTFEQVEEHYNSITPLRGSDNIRPLGDRRRKWEHIVKVSDNKYVLCDVLWDDKAQYIYQETYDGMLKRAAVTWTRSPSTGIVRIRIRNGSGEFSHNARYSFLERALPSFMDFEVSGGKQFVTYNDKRHYLPKSKWVHKGYWESWKANGSSWYTKTSYTKNDDKAYLEFERDPKTVQWSMVGDSHREPVTRYRVSKDKKAYREAINTYTEWAWVMRDLLAGASSAHYDWEARHKNRLECGVAVTDNEAFRAMLKDEDDPRRTPVVVYIYADIGEYSWEHNTTMLPQDPKVFARRFKAQIDKLAGFKTKFEDYK